MKTGTVKWFNDAKGFGFITPDDRGADLFVHHTSIKVEGFRTLKEGQRVEFRLVRPSARTVAESLRALEQEMEDLLARGSWTREEFFRLMDSAVSLTDDPDRWTFLVSESPQDWWVAYKTSGRMDTTLHHVPRVAVVETTRC